MPAAAAVNALVPLPFRSPVSVVAPVPPLLTVSVPAESTPPDADTAPENEPILSEPSDATCEYRFVDDAVVEKKLVVVALVAVRIPNPLTPENVLLFARRVDDAAVMVISAEPLNATPLMFRAVLSVVAVDALPVRAPMTVVNHAVLPEMRVVVALAKVLRPVQVLSLARSVEEAAVITMFPVPSKVVPLMVRPVWSAVAVPALPEILIPAVPAEILAAVRLVRFAPDTAPKSPLQVPEVMVPTLARLARVVRFGSVVVALRRLSKRMLVQYKLLPSARAVVVVPAITPATRFGV